MTWFNNGNQIGSGSEYSIMGGSQSVNVATTVSSTLSILVAITNSHAGLYTCRAQLDTEPSMDSSPVNLTVQRK